MIINEEPLVSIVMPAFNREKLIARAIDSVLLQTYQNWELFVVDDRSTDNTRQVIERYCLEDSRIKYFLNEREKGPGGARNQGLLQAQGRYIAFLDSDDIWMKHHLTDSINVLMTENIKVSFALWIEKTETGEIKYDEKPGKKEIFDEAVRKIKPRVKSNKYFFSTGLYEFTGFNYFYYFQINTMVFEKEILQTTGMFDEEIYGPEDIDFVHRVYARYEICLIWDYHFYYCQGKDNLFFFSDREKITLDQIENNIQILQKFNRQILNDCKYIKRRILFMKKLDILKDKKKSIGIGRRYLFNKLITSAYINRKLNKEIALKSLVRSFIYGFNKVQLLILVKILFPSIFNGMKIDEQYFIPHL